MKWWKRMLVVVLGVLVAYRGYQAVFPLDGFSLDGRRYGLSGAYEGLGWLPFDADAWLHSTDTSRYRMLKDLLANRRIVGASVDDVTRALGPPQVVDRDGSWRYALGPEPTSTPFDALVLVLRVREGRAVTSAHLAVD